MALAGIKFDTDSGGFVSNCFPVRGLLKRDVQEGDGAWLVAHRAEQRRRFKAVLCAKPRTYSRIREERKRAEDEGTRMTASRLGEDKQEEPDQPVLDGYYLMKHCCVEDPADLCSINISGQDLSEVRSDDFDIFDNVAYINAGENLLPFEAFRGFPALRELEMPLNGLRSLKIDFSDFALLEVLDLSYNNLSQEDVLALGLLPLLRVLHVTGNNFHTLPVDMSLPYLSSDRKIRRQRFAKLEVLLLDDNKLSDINVFAALAGLPKLRHINMEKNQIFCIPQLKCVEGRVVTHDGTQSKRPYSDRPSARRSKSRQSGLLSARKEATEQLQAEATAESLNLEAPASTRVTTELKNVAENRPMPSDLDIQHLTTPAEKSESQDDLDLNDLMKDDFSLGDLSNRITELEEETAKGRDANVVMEEDYVPKVLPPFPELRYLNLAHNQIFEEDALLAVAAWPLLVHLVIHNNPLALEHKGDPPLLKRFLSDRLGIKLQRKDQPRLIKPNIEIQKSKGRMVSDIVPKVPRSTIEERIQQLALEAPKSAPAAEPGPSKTWLSEDRTLSGLDLETSKRMPLPPIPPTPQSSQTQAWAENLQQERVLLEKDVEKEEEGDEAAAPERPESDTFFMTQVDGQQEEENEGEKEVKKQRNKRSRRKEKKEENANNSSDDRYRGFELLLDVDSDVEMEVELPKDIQGNVRALKHALGHTLVYRDASVDLDRVKRTVPEFRRAPVPPPKPHKSRQDKIDDMLHHLRTQETADEEPLVNVLNKPHGYGKKFPDAKHLLSQLSVPPAKPHKSRQEKIDDMLHHLRTQETAAEESLVNVLNEPHGHGKKFSKTKRLLSQASVPPAKPHKSRQEKIDDLLPHLRTQETATDVPLVNVLNEPRGLGKKFPETKRLLSQVQRRYNAVRVSSMKEAAEARKIIDQAFEVLNKPKQTYTPSS